MKKYRQKRGLSGERNSSNKMFSQYISEQRGQKERKEMACLKDLVQGCWEGQVVKIICRGKVFVSVENVRGVSGRKPSRGRRQGDVVWVGGDTSITLRQCLEQIQDNIHKTFVFKGKNQVDIIPKAFRTSQHFAQNKKPQQKHKLQINTVSTNTHQRQILKDEHRNPFSKILPQKNMNNDKDMFTVEEIKESGQSESKSSFRSNVDKENRQVNVRGNQINFYCHDENQNYLDKIKNCQEAIKEKKEVEPVEIESEDKMTKTKQNDTFYKPISEGPSHQQNTQLPSEHFQIKTQEQSRFSFEGVMRKGLIQNQPKIMQDPLMSFKIIGDQEIESEKKNGKNQVQAQSFIQMSELSSIVSTTKEDPSKKQGSPDSLKYEVRNLNQYGKEEVEVEKVNLTNLNEQRQENIDNCIHITEKKVEMKEESEYTVHYDLRFLKEKRSQTEVVRLSPLRFRKKEELVPHLLSKQIIQKESTSITHQ